LDTVFISGLRVDTVIGVNDWERTVRQTLVLDLELAGDIRAAAAGDALRQTVDYAAVSDRVTQHIEASRCQLIETLAEEVAAIVQREFAVPWLRLRLSKPGAVPAADAVGVAIERGQQP